MLVFAAAVASALVFSFFCSISEAVLLSVSHADIESLGESRAGTILRKFKKQIDVPIAAILILNTIANTMGAAVGGATFAEEFDAPLWVFSVTFTVAVLLFTEIVPKTLGVTFVRRLAAPVAFSVNVLRWLLAPAIALTRTVSGLLTRGRQAPVTSLEEIGLLAALGRIEGAVLPRVATIIEGATRLRSLRARDVMVPRTSVAVISGQRSLADNLRMVRASGHSRFPYSDKGDLDSVQGIILTKDLMFHLREAQEEPEWAKLYGAPLMVSGATPLDRLLRTFQEERRHMALVLDEYGGTQGIVTMEDVLEEIVGEIEDESDRVGRFITRRPDGSVLCSGRAESRKVFELFGVTADVESLSIGGFVAEQVGRVPNTGDQFCWNGIEVDVIVASPRRAERVVLRRVKPDDDASSVKRASEAVAG